MPGAERHPAAAAGADRGVAAAAAVAATAGKPGVKNEVNEVPAAVVMEEIRVRERSVTVVADVVAPAQRGSADEPAVVPGRTVRSVAPVEQQLRELSVEAIEEKSVAAAAAAVGTGRGKNNNNNNSSGSSGSLFGATAEENERNKAIMRQLAATPGRAVGAGAAGGTKAAAADDVVAAGVVAAGVGNLVHPNDISEEDAMEMNILGAEEAMKMRSEL